MSCLINENVHWSKKVENLELAATESKRTRTIIENENLHAQSSTSYKGKSSVNELENKSSWSMLEKIISKLDDLTDSIDDKTVNQTVFVKPQYSLGYYGPSEFDTKEQVEHEKIRVELAEKNDRLGLALQTSKDKTLFLEEKIKVLEQYTKKNVLES